MDLAREGKLTPQQLTVTVGDQFPAYLFSAGVDQRTGQI